ncbi:hypothetical protein [Gracilibacillus dipsosauri]|uniref:ABC transporter permease n=1 Tax=Gracilibacillus dipsosauri TaxID=178340 RepID=A0A317KU23_9BACI|nr:hypothetical protein [Gracilibacillus dipsosauri]PWU66664.1 hypothetical protein DLJ74_19835 [Gracilibacillus dipsosauri]
MKHLINADFKKISFLTSHRNYLIVLSLLSISFGLIFLFTLGVTQGKDLTELPAMEVIDISLLGMDVAAIMLIIFSATFISKEFSHDAIHTSLAITPLRQKFYLSKILFIMILSLIISITLTLIIFGLDQLVLLTNNMRTVSLNDQVLLSKLFGTVILPLFYSLLSAAGTFYFRSAAGGIIFAIGVMFLPALIKLFPASFSDMVLMLLPEKSLHTLTEMSTVTFNGQLMSAILILLSWILISNILGLWKLKKADF